MLRPQVVNSPRGMSPCPQELLNQRGLDAHYSRQTSNHTGEQQLRGGLQTSGVKPFSLLSLLYHVQGKAAQSKPTIAQAIHTRQPPFGRLFWGRNPPSASGTGWLLLIHTGAAVCQHRFGAALPEGWGPTPGHEGGCGTPVSLLGREKPWPPAVPCPPPPGTAAPTGIPPTPPLPPPGSRPRGRGRGGRAYRGVGEPRGEAGGVVQAGAVPPPPPRGCCSFFFGRQWGKAERRLGAAAAAAEGRRRGGGAAAPSGSESSDSLRPKRRWKRPRRAIPGSAPRRRAAAGLWAAAVHSRRQPGQERQRGERGAAGGSGLSAGMDGAAVAAARLGVCV